MAPSADATPARPPLAPLAAGIAAALVAAAVLYALRWHEDWNSSEGVYALTARALLDGGDVYGRIVVAQPPGVFVLAAPVLAIADDLDALRAVLAVGGVLAGALVAVAAWRVTGSRVAAAAAAPVAVLAPWSVHEQGLLTPEVVALPVLAAAVLLAARRRTAAWAGVLAAVLVAVKLPLLLPALALVLLAADRRRAGVAFVVVLAALAAGSFAAFGSGVVDDPVLAQLEVGRHDAGYVARLLVQAGWNLLPLLVGVAALALAWRRGWRGADPAQLRVLAGTALATLLTLASLTKDGSALNVLPPVELLLVPLAVAGVVALIRPAPGAGRGRVAARAAVVVAALLFVAQPVSLVASPTTGGALFRRPGSAVAFQVGGTRAAVDAAVARARRCPAGVATSASADVAFRAHRRRPDGQPDDFLPARASRLRGVAARMAADVPRCP